MIGNRVRVERLTRHALGGRVQDAHRVADGEEHHDRGEQS
jgi:hypothetical protein